MIETGEERNFARTGYAVITWNFIIPGTLEGLDLYDNEKRAALFADLVHHIVISFTEFASIGGIAIHTDSPDDASYEVKTPNFDDLSKLDKYMRVTYDISDIYVWFDLKCVTRSLADPFQIPKEVWDGWIFIHNHIGDNGSADPNNLVRVSFEFHNAIYSPARLSDEYLRHAELDSLALSSFVRRLEKFPYLKFQDTDNEAGYRPWLAKYGLSEENQFKLPEQA